MVVREKINSHFLNLLGDKEFAMAYFYGKDISEYNKNRLTELQSNLEISKKFYNRMASLLSITQFFRIENLIDITSKIEKQHQQVMSSIRELDIFESNLAFLMISGILDIERAKKLGFDEEFIDELISEYKMQTLNPYNEYYYNEQTGRTSEMTENGKMIVLSRTPWVVSDTIKKKYKDRN